MEDKTKQLRILIIDEETEFGNQLAIQNGEVIFTTSFQEAISLLSNENFDLTFINIEMRQFIEDEEFDALKLIRKITHESYVPIILIVPNLAKTKEEFWWKAYPSAWWYIEKPYTEKDIEAMCKQMC